MRRFFENISGEQCLEGCEWPKFLISVGIARLDRPYVEYLWLRVLLPMRNFGEVFAAISLPKRSYMACSIAQRYVCMENIFSCC